jgi:linoleoyl-CoA desaturase
MATSTVSVRDVEFATVLRHRLDAYFQDQNLSRRAETRMWVKVIAGFSLAILTYASLYLFPVNNTGFFLLYLVHGLTQLFIMLNIAHDANHYAVATNKTLGAVLAHCFDVFGINSYMWRVLHNQGHHPNINVCGEDEDVVARGYLRFSPYVKKNFFHRFQHLYAWILYGLSTFDYVLMKDWDYFFFTNYRRAKQMKHPVSEYVKLFLFKAFYYTYMLILPVIVLHRSPVLVFAAFFTAHFLVGLIAQFIFQTTHAIKPSYFPATKDDVPNYSVHVLNTTADYATGKGLSDWLLGGLNHHVVHHLCPGVCHSHYPPLTEIVKQTAAEFGVQYRENRTIWVAIGQHYTLLKQMGKLP